MRHDRQDRILKLISEKPIGTQEELSDLLTKEGFNATQATISRDIRQLGLTKVPCETGGFKYAALGKGSAEDMSEKFIRVLHDGFVSMDMAQNILNYMNVGFSGGECRCIGLPEIIPGRFVKLKGIDDKSDGSYFISEVAQILSEDGYNTEFVVSGLRG